MPDPLGTVEAAFNKLKLTVNANDAHVFQSTTLNDVYKAAEEIERVQRQRRSLRCMKRIKPLLDFLEKYSKPMEILSNGTPYLPWVWAPIKLMLELSSGYINIFDKLVDAYVRISDAMPQIDRLENAFKDVASFRMVLAMVYGDILEFHRRAYKFFRRRAWHLFFDSLWKSFDSRFNGIIESLAKHKELLTKEAVTIDLVEARSWRARLQEDLEIREKVRSDTYIHDTVAWLNISSTEQVDELDKLLSKRLDGTCQWILQNSKFKTWKDDAHGEPVLWVKGIPGAGKTILCSYLISNIQQEQQITTAYHICNSYTIGKSLAAEIMRSLTMQLLRQNIELAAYVFENYANKGFPPSIAHLRTLIKNLILTIPATRICIDGLDEYPPSDQRSILNELLALTKTPNNLCRILFSSRDVENIRKQLQNKPTISFRDEKEALERDIQAYVHDALGEVREQYSSHTRLLDEIESKIITKADGMFLWVRLVIISLKECYSVQQLKESADTLPDGLDQAYKRILDHVVNELTPKQAAWAGRILEWLACSFRPLKIYEIQDGISFHTEGVVLNDETKLDKKIVDLCKPLIEEGPDNTIDFVHYSAKEYILHQASGPFLSKVHAHYDIAFACINYLNTSLQYRDPNVEDELRIRVVKGFHGLHPYANEYWFQHLLQYSKFHEDLENASYPLESALEELSRFWKKQPGNATKAIKLDDTTTADGIQNSVEALDELPWVQSMGTDILMFRAYLSQEKFAHQSTDALEARELNHDPTHFGETGKQYQMAVQFLLDCEEKDLPTGITLGMLNDFKSIYTDTAFLCRYLECPRHSTGFPSAAKRTEHESSHAKPLRCADSSCEFFTRGFNSKSGLIKHNKKYHPAPEEMDPPKFEPRREETPPPPPPPPPPPAIIEAPRPEAPKPVENTTKQVQKQQPVPTKRVSRAKRGLKVHNCDRCPKIYSRAEGLRRHNLSHEDPKFFCHYNRCGRAFHRQDLLDRHHKRHEMTEEVQAAASALVGLEPSTASQGEVQDYLSQLMQRKKRAREELEREEEDEDDEESDEEGSDDYDGEDDDEEGETESSQAVVGNYDEGYRSVGQAGLSGNYAGYRGSGDQGMGYGY